MSGAIGGRLSRACRPGPHRHPGFNGAASAVDGGSRRHTIDPSDSHARMPEACGKGSERAHLTSGVRTCIQRAQREWDIANLCRTEDAGKSEADGFSLRCWDFLSEKPSELIPLTSNSRSTNAICSFG